MVSAVSPGSDSVRCSRPTAIGDIGADPIDGDPPYLHMLRPDLCTVTGFEPEPAVGDGETHCVKVASGPTMTSLPRPALQRPALNGCTEWGAVHCGEDVKRRATAPAVAFRVYGSTGLASFSALFSAMFSILGPDHREATSADAGARCLERVGR